MNNGILILDFGSQYTQLIARRVREEQVYCEIHPCTIPFQTDFNIEGIILSGGPASVLGDEAPPFDVRRKALGPRYLLQQVVKRTALGEGLKNALIAVPQ